jgi:hypothetical protein
MAPPGLAKFDSTTGMLRALANLLHGEDFSGLGQSATLRFLVQFADRVPRQLRERLFALLGAQEGVKPARAGQVDTHAVARWAVRQYPQRRYPAVLVGSSNGALMHMAAAFGLPWLPQTFLTLVQHRGIHPDNARAPMEAGLEPGRRFLAANPDVQLHHMHDPVQDRLMLGYVTYFRFKYRYLPPAYEEFLQHSLLPNGAIIIVDCQQRWPVTRLGERHFYQFGAVGGATVDDYFHGSPRVSDYLQRYRSPFRQWQPPAPDGDSPEAEWGFEPALAEPIADIARRHNYRVLRLTFAEPETLSPVVADFHRDWYAELGIPENRLLLESFIVLEPYWALRTGTVPFWMCFNKEPSRQAAERYLSSVQPYDRLYMMLFAHGMNSIGLPPIAAWQRLTEYARRGGGFLGMNPGAYPAHFSVYAKYSAELRALQPHYPLPPPLPFERLENCIARWSQT